MKIIFINALMFLIIFLYHAVYAENVQKTKESPIDFFGSLAAKGVYSSGISDAYTYNRTDAAGGFKSVYIDLSVYIRRYSNYQTTDGNGVYEYRSFYEGGLSMEAHLFRIINLSGEYSRADGFNDLKRYTYYGAVELDFTRVVLSADYSHEDFEYRISSNNVKAGKQDFSFIIEYNFTDYFSADISYKHDNTYFNTLSYDYYKDIIRTGATIMPSNYLFIIGGCSTGKDSEDYFIYGADLGTTLLFFSRFKLFFFYSFNYYDPPQTESSGSSGGGSGHGPGSVNPYLSSDKTDESYSSHILTLGMSVVF